MKAHGKGLAISINEPNRGTSDTNAWKMRMEAQFAEPPPMQVFKPLACWPAVPHSRQKDIDDLRSVKSRYA